MTLEAVLIVPTPKTITHTTSRDNRLRIQSLFNEAGWEIDEVLNSFNRIWLITAKVATLTLTFAKHCLGLYEVEEIS